MGVTRLTRENETAALEYLSRRPIDNAFLIWLIHVDRSLTTRLVTYVCSRAGDIYGVAYFGAQVVLAAQCDAQATIAFARIARGYRGERMIISSRETASAYWQAVQTWHDPARLTRESQPLLMVDLATLRIPPCNILVRRAEMHDADDIAENSALMIAGELERDPSRSTADYSANIRRMIDRRLWWLGESESERVFYCHIGAQTDATIQLQGIWVPAAFRGRGLATASLANICECLLTQTPTVSLYVNDFNASALRLYERVGFTQIGELSTYVF
ncbi:MAG: GNAT family N-acetyltransferase [Candidatus Eremiobacteraeota bacterium]|nr:GNAT family N-acetyltransferase [Candidatus Eremiobacteraeota bacterium]